MAFFGFGGFNDPFFGEAHHMMRRQMQEMDAMNQMMNQMMDPFGFMRPGMQHPSLMLEGSQDPRRGDPRQQMIDDSMNRHQQQQRRQIPQQQLMPFGFGGGLLGGGGLFGGIGQMFRQMEQLQEHAINDPNSHVFTHSQVITYNGLGEEPQYYEATNSVRKAGNVKEVRKTVRDSAKGLEKMSIGHHIDGRGHVIEKSRKHGGNIQEEQQFINLKEDEAPAFQSEWSDKTRHSANRLGSRTAQRTLAVEDNPASHSRSDRASPYRRDKGRRRDKGPIIEEVE